MELVSKSLDGVAAPAWIIRAPGDIDLAKTPCLVDALRTARREGDGLVVLDLHEARHLASSGVHALLSAQRRLAATGRRLVLACDREKILMTAPLDGLREVLDMYPDVEAALTSERRISRR